MYLRDRETTDLLFGGGAGGGKTVLGCSWAIINCFEYAGCRGLIGRKELKELKQSTLLTFFETAAKFGLKSEYDYHYNQIEGVITFKLNGSQIYLKDLAQMPSDPNYDSLGSTEYTFAFIDEAQQVKEKAKNIIASRIRYKLDDFGIIPKLLMTSNPSKTFLYTDFYKLQKEGKLPKHRKFVQSLVGDNQHLAASYIENLKRLDKTTKERLLYGNWEYDDDPSALMEFDAITDIFTNTVDTAKPIAGQKHIPSQHLYIISDVARFGQDRTTISVWNKLHCISLRIYTKQPLNVTAEEIKKVEAFYKVPRSHILIDEDGIGGGVLDMLPGAKGFVANATPFMKGNYTNVKAQCHYMLAEKVNNRLIRIDVDTPEIKASLIEELEQIKRKDADKDGKAAVISKEHVKEVLGRSPDLSDTLAMRMWFEVRPAPRLS